LCVLCVVVFAGKNAELQALAETTTFADIFETGEPLTLIAGWLIGLLNTRTAELAGLTKWRSKCRACSHASACPRCSLSRTHLPDQI
jgi:hypothetical protein